MRQLLAKEIVRQVRESYRVIGEDFSKTRYAMWPEIEKWEKKYLRPRARVLDAGCGNGRLVKSLARLAMPIEYVGFDSNQEFLAAMREKFGIYYKDVSLTWQEGELFEFPFEDTSFDTIFAVACLHHIPSHELRARTVREMNRVLRPGGIMVMTNWYLWTPAAFRKYRLAAQMIPHFLKGYDKGDFFVPWKNAQGEEVARRYYHSFTTRELSLLLYRNGFEVLRNEKCYLTGKPGNVGVSLLTIAKKIEKK